MTTRFNTKQPRYDLGADHRDPYHHQTHRQPTNRRDHIQLTVAGAPSIPPPPKEQPHRGRTRPEIDPVQNFKRGGIDGRRVLSDDRRGLYAFGCLLRGESGPGDDRRE